MILIDSIYIHNGGGKNILDNLCNKIQEFGLDNNFFFLLDSRYSSEIKFKNYKKINPSEINRFKFYRKNINDFNRVICLANVPPPIKIEKHVDIYFHNDLFINPTKNSLTLLNKLILLVKSYYIQNRNRNKYVWNVQTNLMKNKLINEFEIIENNINIFPIFDSNKITSTKTNNSFFYVCNSSKHKNHKRLMDAFIKAANKIHGKLHLKLTLSDNDFKKSEYNRTNIPNNLLIQNIGIVGKEKLSNLYLESKFLIFPSLNESLGLPLIEAVNRGCFIIASDKEYVKQVVNPSIVFNPYSSDSISEAIVNSLSNKSLKKSELIIENKIDTFVKYLLQHV